MKTTNSFIPALALILFIALLAGCAKSDAPEKAEAPAKAGVTIDAATQARIALKLELPAPRQWQPEMRAYGRVVDPAPLLEMLVELERSEITLDGSKKELERAEKLQKDNNISERAFQELDVNYHQNLAAAAAIASKIQLVWGSKIAALEGPLTMPLGSIRQPDELLAKLPDAIVFVRIELPAGERLDDSVASARIVSLAEKVAPVPATLFDKLPIVDPLTQQQGLLFKADLSPTNRLTPGEAVTAFIKTAGEPVAGVVVPASAVLRHEGKGWVYVQTEANQFLRTEIPLDRPVDEGCFVSENLTATNRIVVTGAQTILSAELGSGFSTGQRD
ncbi:MAG: hypothetical protein WCK57_09370 [Verrucomicrobiae bacterium]